MAKMEKRRGIVIWYDQALDYGMINVDDGKYNVFVSGKELEKTLLEVGMRVEFETLEGYEKNLVAKNVEVIDE